LTPFFYFGGEIKRLSVFMQLSLEWALQHSKLLILQSAIERIKTHE